MGTEQNPLPISELLDILRKEQGISKYSFIKLNTVIQDAKFNKNCAKPFHNTEDVFVYSNNQKYSITKKTIKGLNIRSTCGKEWPIDFQFDKIERKVYNYPDLSKYKTNKSIRVCEGGGWYSNSPLFLKDGKYYT